jgi:hypothetical protein
VLRNKGKHPRRILTANGEIELLRRYFWAASEAGVYPVDQAAGVEQDPVSAGAKEILCRLGMTQNFAQAAEDAARIGNVPVCRERLRGIVEQEARIIRQKRDRGQIPAGWSAAAQDTAAVTPRSSSSGGGGGGGGGGPTRIYHGTDGVMVPTVTAAEKDKRRQKHVTRRQQRGKAGLGNAKPLKPKKAGSDERFKEMKIGIFYDQAKTHRHLFATEDPCQAYGPLLASHAGQIGFAQAQQRIAVVDGALWIYSQVCGGLLGLGAILLDFYHLSQHVHQTAVCCLGGEGAGAGAGEAAARTWAAARLEEFKTQGLAAVLMAIAALHRKVRSAAKRKSLANLREYLVQRQDMLEYRRALAEGWDIGSGPTEAACKTLTLRLKQSGMKWDRDNAAAMMNLTALYESGQAKTYWQSYRTAA